MQKCVERVFVMHSLSVRDRHDDNDTLEILLEDGVGRRALNGDVGIERPLVMVEGAAKLVRKK